MLTLRRLALNAGSSAFQTVFSAIVLFVVYRQVVSVAGAAGLGLWSVVLATVSASRIVEFGFGAGSARFVPKYLARGDTRTASLVVQSGAISVAVVFIALALTAAPLIEMLLGHVVTPETEPAAAALVPYALAILCLNVTGTVVLGSLDGCQRADLRNLTLAAGSIVLLVSTLWLLPKYGLIGLAWAQVAQAAFGLLAGWVLLRRQLDGLPVIPWQWNPGVFRELFGYGIKIQIAGIFLLLCEPITKGLTTAYGDLQLTGYYEMASRFVMQVRSVAVSAAQALVPAFARLNEEGEHEVQHLYSRLFRACWFAAFPLMGLVVASAPAMSYVLTGSLNETFVGLTLLMSGAWLLNILWSPAYFANLGRGDLRWNVIGHVWMGVVTAVLGLLLSVAVGGIGAILAWVFGLVTGSALVVVQYHRRHGLRLTALLSRADLWLATSALLGLGLAASIYFIVGRDTAPWMFSIQIFGPFLLVATIGVLAHPFAQRGLAAVTAALRLRRGR